MTGLRGRALWSNTLLIFLVVFNGLLFVYRALPNLYDTDAYYHLAAARLYATTGIPHELAWTRFSAMREGFGDKELLFHVLLAPFAMAKDPAAGGRLALALLDALVAALVGFLGMRTMGRWGALMPFWLLATSTEFTLRLMRLRPELLSLLLLLLAVASASARRYRLLGVIVLLYTLSYTAFQTLLGLALLWFLCSVWARREREWRLLLYPGVGAALGLVLHPQFPANLRIWWLQNVAYFRFKDALDVGSEIRSQLMLNMLVLNAGWLLGMLVLWRSREKGGGGTEGTLEDARAADFWLVTAVVFGGLYLAMMRFATYFVPVATLALCHVIPKRGERLSRYTALPWRGRVPFAAAFGASLLFCLTSANYILVNLVKAGVFASQPGAWERFGKAVPPGAKVAATWQDAQLYAYTAPQGRYLNVLDPVFMAAPFPEIYGVQRALFAGEEPDVPLALRTGLDSDFVAFVPPHQKLADRLSNDPRLKQLFGEGSLLYQVVPGANDRFVLDWKLAPSGTRKPPPAALATSGWRVYPRASGEARAVEGYVDARRLLGEPSGCSAFLHDEQVAAPTTVVYELAAYGPAVLFLDGRWLASTQGQTEAVLGKGILVPVALSAGPHQLFVSTCAAGNQMGFYFLDRTGQPAAR